MKRFFITATGTDIGKTFVTAALTWQLRAKGVNVKSIKPIASGFDEGNPESDSAILLAARGLPDNEHDIVSPWRFAAPISPDMAARAENKSLPLSDIVQFCQQGNDADILFIEGAGGVMTPLSDKHTMLDLMERLAIPIIFVTGSYVGTLSHTLTALQVLESRKLAVHSIIVNETAGSAASLAETCESLRHHTGPTNIRLLQRLANRPELWKHAPNLTEGFL